jgi:peptidoglycan/LPS O-acetylase OafA/YrhL
MARVRTIPTNPDRRSIPLDVLRGIAILLVIPNHGLVFNRDVGKLQFLTLIFDRLGWTGVDLFFVLSGFLIGGLLFREIQKTGRLNSPRFLVRRAFKIWPPYFCLLAWSIANTLRHGKSYSQTWHLYWPNLIHLQNYFFHGPEPQTWSLAVEEHFYLSLAVALVVMLAVWPKWIVQHFPAIAIFSIGLIALSRSIEGLFVPYSLENLYFPTHLRIDALLFGVLLGNVAVFHAAAWDALLSRAPIVLFLGICYVAVVAFVPREKLFGHTAAYTLLYLGYGSILIGALGLQRRWAHAPPTHARKILNATGRVVAWIGVFSYGIYLWHIDFARNLVWYHLVPRLDRLPAQVEYLAILLIYVIVAVLVGAAMSLIVEFPSLRIRDRLFPRAS